MKLTIPKGPLVEPSEDDSEGGLDAAQDVLEAIADKDASALNLALKRHYEICAGEGDEDDSDEE